jgi:hypothetical protein
LTGTAGDASDNDTVDVVVRAISVDAGEDQKTAFGEEVTLQGSGEGIVSYRWQQVPETTVELSTPNQQQTRFTAPMTSTTLTFELVGIGNGGLETTDTVAVNVKALVVDAGEEQTVEPGEEVTLQGSAPGAESYEWVQLSGPTVELSPTDTLTTSFTIPADADEPLVFQFMARGPGGEEDTDLVRVVVGTQTRLYLPLLSR